MGSQDFSDRFSDLKVDDDAKDINILLLGETGVGKSTFINSIANYLHFKSFKKAEKADSLMILIPSQITVTDENYKQHVITIGSDANEYLEIGAAGTQDVKTYVFPIGEGKTRLRLIDSPGMGDPRGISQDDVNCDNILLFLSQLKELHAICFLMKPTTTRITVFFEYCIKQILSRLDKSASKNIIFIFTNTRGNDYTAGDTLPCLQSVIDEVKKQQSGVSIPLKENIFCLDNEAFRMLVAIRKGVSFNDKIKEKFIESWKTSSKECLRLISYILGDVSTNGLKPHQLSNTISINEARRVIIQLSRPLADISQLIHDNIRILDRHKENLKMTNQSLDELKKKLYIPIMNLKKTELSQPVTVCATAKCAQPYKVGELTKWHYRQRCHDPCYLKNVTKELLGDPSLIHCAAMSNKTCIKCTCDFSVHMHIYYLTTAYEDKIEDKVVKANITGKQDALKESERIMHQIDNRKKELEDERDIILKSTAQFAHFLQHNAITPFNDSYKTYIEYLITRERNLGQNGDVEVISNLEQMMYRYDLLKQAFDNSLSLHEQNGLGSVVPSAITAQSIMNTIHSLYNLQHNGKKLKELLKTQKASRYSEYNKSCEYIHPNTSQLSESESKPKKNKENEAKKGGKSTDDEGKQRNRQAKPQKNNISPLFAKAQHRPPPQPSYNSRTFERRPQQVPRNDSQNPNITIRVDYQQGSQNRPRGPHYNQQRGGQPYHHEGPYRQQEQQRGGGPYHQSSREGPYRQQEPWHYPPQQGPNRGEPRYYPPHQGPNHGPNYVEPLHYQKQPPSGGYYGGGNLQNYGGPPQQQYRDSYHYQPPPYQERPQYYPGPPPQYGEDYVVPPRPSHQNNFSGGARPREMHRGRGQFNKNAGTRRNASRGPVNHKKSGTGRSKTDVSSSDSSDSSDDYHTAR